MTTTDSPDGNPSRSQPLELGTTRASDRPLLVVVGHEWERDRPHGQRSRPSGRRPRRPAATRKSHRVARSQERNCRYRRGSSCRTGPAGEVDQTNPGREHRAAEAGQPACPSTKKGARSPLRPVTTKPPRPLASPRTRSSPRNQTSGRARPKRAAGTGHTRESHRVGRADRAEAGPRGQVEPDRAAVTPGRPKHRRNKQSNPPAAPSR